MEEPQERADELEGEADKLEERSEKVGREIKEAESDWEAKKGDASVPGAVPDGDEGDEGDG